MSGSEAASKREEKLKAVVKVIIRENMETPWFIFIIIESLSQDWMKISSIFLNLNFLHKINFGIPTKHSYHYISKCFSHNQYPVKLGIKKINKKIGNSSPIPYPAFIIPIVIFVIEIASHIMINDQAPNARIVGIVGVNNLINK
jgi:hypothetical protein